MPLINGYKRILMIAPTPFFADRGCHVRILGEAQALIALGNPLLLCTYHIGRNVDGIPIDRTIKIPWYKKLSPGPSVHKFYIDVLLLWKVLRACRRFRPDVIHAHIHEGIVIGKIASTLFRIPMVADLQGSLTQELLEHKFIPKVSWLLRLMQWIEKTIDHMPSHLIISSTKTTQDCLDTFGLPPCKVSTIMDGVDLKLFSPQEKDPALRAALGITANEMVIVYVGVLTEYQGINLLLETIPLVVQEYPKAKFLIIGYPNEELYRQKARFLGIDKWTCFTGKIPYQEVPRYLSLAHVAISPKISTTEANLKLFTYMAMALPTVVFENPVNREILGDLGIYAQLGNVRSLATVLVRTLQDREHGLRLGTESRKKAVDDYSWIAVAKRLCNIYDSVAYDSLPQSRYLAPTKR